MMTENELAQLIKPAGFNKSKPKRLIGLCRYIVASGNIDKLAKRETDVLREGLLELNGVGPETADTLLNYVFDKARFVIDEYTRRTVRQLELTNRFDYNYLQKVFEAAIPVDVETYRNFHALIIVNQVGKERAKMNVL